MNDLLKQPDQLFQPEQKEYLEGFFSGVKVRGAAFTDVEPLPEKKKLCKEEKIKAAQHPLDAFPELRRKAKQNLPPETEDVFQFNFSICEISSYERVSDYIMEEDFYHCQSVAYCSDNADDHECYVWGLENAARSFRSFLCLRLCF